VWRTARHRLSDSNGGFQLLAAQWRNVPDRFQPRVCRFPPRESVWRGAEDTEQMYLARETPSSQLQRPIQPPSTVRTVPLT
jgi:hypothetical protein